MKKVLFVCGDNADRSQMAEAYLNKLGKGRFHAQSAGFAPAMLNEYAVTAMREDNIDISGVRTKSVYELYQTRQRFSYVITICSRENEADCPAFLGVKRRLHWDIPDPADFPGTGDKRLYRIRELRDEIKSHVMRFISEGIKSANDE